MYMYKVSYYTEDWEQYKGVKQHNDITDDDVIEVYVYAEDPKESIQACMDYLTESITNNFFPVIDETGKMTDKVPYTVEIKGDELFAFAEGIDESFEHYFGFKAEKIG